MKLMVDELRPLISSSEDILTHLPRLQGVESLDLSNGGIVGDQIEKLLRFISMSSSPVALRSVDLGHNDVGTIALARLLQASASKLPNLVALDLFENGIRDEGALALVSVIQDEADAGNLPLLTSVALHDNDISETVLLSIEAMWRAIPAKRAFGSLPAESASLSFADLLKREVEVVKAKHVAVVAEKLEPLSVFIKTVLWHLVNRRGKIGGQLKLLISASPPEVFDKCALIRLDTVIEGSTRTDEEQRAKTLLALRERAIEERVGGGYYQSLADRAEETDALLVDTVLAQMDTLHASATDAATDAAAAAAKFKLDNRNHDGVELMEIALSSALGLSEPNAIEPAKLGLSHFSILSQMQMAFDPSSAAQAKTEATMDTVTLGQTSLQILELPTLLPERFSERMALLMVLQRIESIQVTYSVQREGRTYYGIAVYLRQFQSRIPTSSRKYSDPSTLSSHQPDFQTERRFSEFRELRSRVHKDAFDCGFCYFCGDLLQFIYCGDSQPRLLTPVFSGPDRVLQILTAFLNDLLALSVSSKGSTSRLCEGQERIPSRLADFLIPSDYIGGSCF